jgi:hypothetical protein
MANRFRAFSKAKELDPIGPKFGRVGKWCVGIDLLGGGASKPEGNLQARRIELVTSGRARVSLVSGD